MTIQEACQRLGKSESTIRRWIKQETLAATKVDDVWDIPETVVNDYLNDQSPVGSDQSDDQGAMVQQLKEENEYLKERIQELEQARKRSDTIMLQLSRQNQQLLEDKRPWWRRLRRKQNQ